MHGVVIKTDILKSMDRKITEGCFYVDVEYILFPMKNVNTILLLDFPVYDYRKGLNEQSTNLVNRQKRRDQHEKVCLGLINYYTEIQEEIKEKAPEAYLMTLTRRFMMRITDRIREERRGLVIINGESLGQVASQTMESMQAINAVTCTPVIRQVVTMDKLEIIDLAQKIDTFDISIQPFEDCCTIFAPDRPKTNPKIKNVEQYERRMDVDALVERAVAGIMVTEITPIEEAQDEVDTLIEDLL